MTAGILYAGDTSLTTAASYLGGVLTHYGLEFDYVASDEPVGPALAGAERSLYILSDYPVNNWQPDELRAVADAVAAGAGLLMIGGWESFHGQAGHYNNTPLAEALPVEMLDSDDRCNCPQPCLIAKLCDHPIVAGLPFDAPPGVGGLNRLTVRDGATEVLSARNFGVTFGDGAFGFQPGGSYPLLVVGQHGAGRTAAFASDVAPHWVGGLVDWGDSRVIAQAHGGEQVEVGCWYAELFARLVRWTMGDMT